ncbi:MAG: tail fiber domain-containing protein [Planctomycetota bacterium]|jgi:hypothetical protein
METRKILVLWFLALGLTVWAPKVSEAAPMGTAFTYQGRLIDANSAADGLYDFEFKLYDSPADGNQFGSTIGINDLDVIDGQFALELDFDSDPNIFNGDARWLEIGVRPGAESDPCEYTTLAPRQEVTPTPYAIYAQSSAGLDASGDVVLTSGTGAVEIGTPNEPADMNVAGGIRANDAIKCGNTIGFWPPEYILSDTGQIIMGKEVSGAFDPGVNVGIGTMTPISKLEVMATENQHGIRSTVPYIAVYGRRTGTSGTWPGVHGECDSLSSNTAGVRGLITSTSPGTNSAGVRGVNNGTGNKGAGVYGWHAGSGSGVYGTAEGALGHGVYGSATATSSTNYGGYFKAAGQSGRGVYGEARGSNGWGVYGYASDSGFGSSQYGGFFKAEGIYGTGVYGLGRGTNARGVYGFASDNGSYSNFGGYFQAAGGSGKGVYGLATGINGRGVWGYATNMGNVTNYGGYFQAEGGTGIGVYSEAAGTSGIGVKANGKWYDFYAAGPGTNYGASSSIRWKSNVRVIDDPLGKVLRLRGVYFNWDEEHGGEHDVGMIAEEVGEVVPEIVGYEENGIDATGMDYGKLTPVLVEAVKALKTELDEQTKQQVKKDAIIERLGEENRALAKRLAAIESLLDQLAQERKELNDEVF